MTMPGFGRVLTRASHPTLTAGDMRPGVQPCVH